MEYSQLFSSLSIGNVSLSNRIVMAPVYTALGSQDSNVSDRMIEYYRERAEGGASMIVVEAMAVHSSGHGMQPQVALFKEGVLEGLERLAAAIKGAGAVAVAQIHHIGKFMTAGKALAPSATTFQFGGAKITSHEISRNEMDEIRQAFVDGALLIQKAGFDMVEIHGGGGYLLASFFSPHSNFREDKYGGSLENRALYPLEVVSAVKEAVGDKYPVGWRLAVDEKLPDGTGLEHNLEFVPMLEKAGIAYISPVVGSYESFFLPEVAKDLKKKGNAVHYSEALKKKVNIPVFANGRIIIPDLAEEILKQDQADAVALGRPLVADAMFAKKALENKTKEIKVCKACDQCIMNIMMGKEITCSRWKE